MIELRSLPVNHTLKTVCIGLAFKKVLEVVLSIKRHAFVWMVLIGEILFDEVSKTLGNRYRPDAQFS